MSSSKDYNLNWGRCNLYPYTSEDSNPFSTQPDFGSAGLNDGFSDIDSLANELDDYLSAADAEGIMGNNTLGDILGDGMLNTPPPYEEQVEDANKAPSLIPVAQVAPSSPPEALQPPPTPSGSQEPLDEDDDYDVLLDEEVPVVQAPAVLAMPNTVFSVDEVEALKADGSYDHVGTISLANFSDGEKKRGGGDTIDHNYVIYMVDEDDNIPAEDHRNVVFASSSVETNPSTSKNGNGDNDDDEDWEEDSRAPNRKRRTRQQSGQAKKKKYELDEEDLPDDPKERKKIRQAKNAKKNRDLAKAAMNQKDEKIEEQSKIIKSQKEELKRAREEIERLKRALEGGCGEGCRNKRDSSLSSSSSDEASKPKGKGGPYKGYSSRQQKSGGKGGGSGNNNSNSSGGSSNNNSSGAVESEVVAAIRSRRGTAKILKLYIPKR